MKLKKCIVFFLMFLFTIFGLTTFVACGTPFEKTVEGGKIRGVETETEGVYSFKGIPYAASPVGENRWKAPQPVEPWDGVKDCSKFGPSAMQTQQKPAGTFTEEFIIADTENYSEDCLTLNVWSDSKGKNKPVLVYVHGGAWAAGGSSCPVYDGEYLASQGIVYVSINYRLGIFGWFASTELLEESDDGSTGNYGFLDIIQALKWVQKNIAVFGGDKSNVTVMGQSAGGNLVDMLLASPKTEGLFQHAVNMSYRDMGSKIGAMLYRQTAGDAYGSLADLRALSAEELLAFNWTSLGVVKDDVYVKYDFQEAMEKGINKDVDVMTGMCCGTGANGDGFYVWGSCPSGVSESDCLMSIQSAYAKARLLGAGDDSHGDTYVYLFSHVMPGENPYAGTFHTSDVPYFLNYFSPLRDGYWEQKDYDLGKTMSLYLINFCKNGDPNGEGLAEWTKNTGTYNYMELNTDSKMNVVPEEISALVKSAFSATIPERYFS